MDKGKSAGGEPSSQPTPNADVYVTGPANNGSTTVVTISRKSILRQITAKLGAIIRTEGIVKLDQSRRIAWLTVEIPPQNSTEDVTTECFHGSPSMTDYDAEENVSAVAITHLISQRNIHVNDVHYAALHETASQLCHYINWSNVLQTRYQLLRVEKDGLLNAHLNLLKRLGLICATYRDILPLVPFAPAFDSSASCIERVVYIGRTPPETRHEELGKELLDVLQEYGPIGNPLH